MPETVAVVVAFFFAIEPARVLCLQKPFSPKFPRLQRYNVDPRLVSVSGISNGAGFAVQMAFIYSGLISGVGSFAGSPYPAIQFVYGGQVTDFPKLRRLYPTMEKWAREGLIDPLQNLRRTRAFVFQGLKDFTVPWIFSKMVVKEFQDFGSAVKPVFQRIPTGHCLPTDNWPPEGDYVPQVGSAQAICNAGFQGVNYMFQHFYGPHFVWPRSNNATPTGQAFKYDQNEFYPDNHAEGALMNNAAFAYVPKACQWTNVPCKLHVVFHGSSFPLWIRLMADGHNGLVHHAGYVQAADANNIIVLFPEASPLNVISWDIYGATGKPFLWKNGTHPLGIAKMIKRVVYGH